MGGNIAPLVLYWLWDAQDGRLFMSAMIPVDGIIGEWEEFLFINWVQSNNSFTHKLLGYLWRQINFPQFYAQLPTLHHLSSARVCILHHLTSAACSTRPYYCPPSVTRPGFLTPSVTKCWRSVMWINSCFASMQSSHISLETMSSLIHFYGPLIARLLIMQYILLVR